MEPSPQQRSSREPTATSGLDDLVQPSHREKFYYGERDADGNCAVWVVEDHASSPTAEADELVTRDFPLRLDLRNHSPTGFEWGYGGSGPAQLALALLADAVGDEFAQTHYQEFKREVISAFGASWSISAQEIRRFISQRDGADSSRLP